ncbi:MAG: OsmC family protein, partial [Gaiellaceae bacterium]
MRAKEFSFPVTIEWLGGTRVATRVSGKSEIETSSPPEFRGSDPTIWSPEDFLVGATASCVAITLVGIAGRQGLPLHALAVSGEGTVGTREDGHFGFSRMKLKVEIDTDEGMEELAREIALKAEEGCL